MVLLLCAVSKVFELLSINLFQLMKRNGMRGLALKTVRLFCHQVWWSNLFYIWSAPEMCWEIVHIWLIVTISFILQPFTIYVTSLGKPESYYVVVYYETCVPHDHVSSFSSKSVHKHQMLIALCALKEAGIIHCDLKPENVSSFHIPFIGWSKAVKHFNILLVCCNNFLFSYLIFS